MAGAPPSLSARVEAYRGIKGTSRSSWPCHIWPIAVAGPGAHLRSFLQVNCDIRWNIRHLLSHVPQMRISTTLSYFSAPKQSADDGLGLAPVLARKDVAFR